MITSFKGVEFNCIARRQSVLLLILQLPLGNERLSQPYGISGYRTRIILIFVSVCCYSTISPIVYNLWMYKVCTLQSLLDGSLGFGFTCLQEPVALDFSSYII